MTADSIDVSITEDIILSALADSEILTVFQGRPYHNVLQGLQGGVANEYYHLTAAQLAQVGTIIDGSGISSPADNDLLVYDTGTGLWTNQTPAEAGLDARYVNLTGDTMTGHLLNSLGTDPTNQFFGGAGNLTTSGIQNTATGIGALQSNTTGSQNVAYGRNALYQNTAGSSNTAIGRDTLRDHVSGVHNTAIGREALRTNIVGVDNIAIGFQAGYYETGSNTLYIAPSITSTPLIYGLFTGTGAGLTIHSQAIDGVPLIVKGIASQASNLQEWQNSSGTVLSGVDERGILFSDGGIDSESVYIGEGAGNSTATGIRNIGIGSLTLKALTIGSNNTFIGQNAGGAISEGGFNTGLGVEALHALTIGSYNFALGGNSFFALTTSSRNVGIGYLSGARIQTGTDNIFLGYQAGYGGAADQTSVDKNIAIGYRSLYTLNTGADKNIAIGHVAGTLLSSGGLNILLGYAAGSQLTTESHRLYIANSGTVTPLIYGLFTGTGAGLTIHSQAIDGVPLIVKGIASQSSNLQEWQDSSGTVLARLEPDGDFFALDLQTSGKVFSDDFSSYSGGAVDFNYANLTNRFLLGASGEVRFVDTSNADVVRITSAATPVLKIVADLDHDGTNVGFYGTAPIAQQTGVAVTAAAIHAALVSLGLITA